MMLSYELRSVLAEIIDPGGGDKPAGEVMDPNDPQKKSEENKMKYKPHAVKLQLHTASKRKMWMGTGTNR